MVVFRILADSLRTDRQATQASNIFGGTCCVIPAGRGPPPCAPDDIRLTTPTATSGIDLGDVMSPIWAV